MADEVWQLDSDSLSGIGRLARAIDLGDGFQFLVLVAETPRASRLSFEHLITILSTTKSPLRIEADPRPAASASDFSANVAAQLEQADASSDGRGRPLVLDAALATAEQNATWEFLFHRLNESRDLLVRRHTGAFVLCLSPDVEGLFGRAAPDFWSVRSLVVRARTESVAHPTASVMLDGFESPLPSSKEEWSRALELAVPWATGEVRDSLASMFAAVSRGDSVADDGLRESLLLTVAHDVPNPTDIKDARLVAQVQVWLARLADGVHGLRLSADQDFPNRALRLWKEKSQRTPGLLEPRREFARTLQWAAGEAAERGNLNAARGILHEATRLADELVGQTQAEDDIIAAHRAFHSLATVETQRGDSVEAANAGRRAIDLLSRLDAVPSRDRERTLHLIGELRLTGEAAGEAGRLDEAIELATKSVALARTLEQDVEARFQLAVSLAYLGSVESDAGRLDLAEAHCRASVTALPDLATRDEHHIRSSSIVLNRLAHVLLFAGKLREAERYASRSVSLIREVRLNQHSPPLSWHDLAYSELLLSKILIEVGAYERARNVVSAAKRRLETLVREHPGPSPWQRELETAQRLTRRIEHKRKAPKPRRKGWR